MKCPCTQHCPRRSAECRISCEEYLAYAEQKMAEYARNAARRNNDGNTPALERRVRNRDKMRREGRIK